MSRPDRNPNAAPRFVGACFLASTAAALAPRWGGWRSGVCVAVAGLAPVAFALVAIAGAKGEFGELRLSLQSLSYTRAALHEHPVSLGGGKVDDTMKEKMENDAAALMRSVVAKRGRNVEVAESTVRQSKSAVRRSRAATAASRRSTTTRPAP